MKTENIGKKQNIEFDGGESKLLLESGEEDEEYEAENGELNAEQSRPKSHLLVLGGFLAFLSGLAYTIQNAIVANEQINFSEALIFRYVFIIVVLLAYTKLSVKIGNRYTKKDENYKNSVIRVLWIFNVDPGQNIHLLRGILLFQGVFAACCILSDFHCVSNMPLGDASAIILSAPLPSMVLSAIFLGTRLRLYKVICGVLLYSGVLLVIRPPFLFHSSDQSLNMDKEMDGETRNYYFGSLMGMVAAVSRAAVFVCTRNKSSSSANLLTFHLSFSSLLFNLAWAGIAGETQIFSGHIFLISSRTWILYLTIAVLGATNLGLVNIALKLASPVLVSFTRSSDIIVAYLIQVLFFHEAASMLAIGGSVCIVFAIGILQLETLVNNLLPESLKFLF